MLTILAADGVTEPQNGMIFTFPESAYLFKNIKGRFLLKNYKYDLGKPEYYITLKALMKNENRLDWFFYKVLSQTYAPEDSGLYTEYPDAEMAARLGELSKPMLNLLFPEFVRFVEKQWSINDENLEKKEFLPLQEKIVL